MSARTKSGKPKFGELLAEAMNVHTQAEADRYLAEIVDCMQRASTTPHTRAELEALARDNLGYWAGYSSHETRARVEPLYRCEHPVFGSIAECGVPDAEWALKAGMRIAAVQSSEERDVVCAVLKAEMRAAHEAAKARQS